CLAMYDLREISLLRRSLGALDSNSFKSSLTPLGNSTLTIEIVCGLLSRFDALFIINPATGKASIWWDMRAGSPVPGARAFSEPSADFARCIRLRAVLQEMPQRPAIS